MQEVADWLEANKKNIIHWFTVDDLNHLRRGGRISKASAFLGQCCKIKPVLDVDDEGRLIPHFKVKGRKKAILELLNRMKEDIKNPDGQTDLYQPWRLRRGCPGAQSHDRGYFPGGACDDKPHRPGSWGAFWPGHAGPFLYGKAAV